MIISRQHGLNPTQSVCFFCGQTKEIMVLGKLKGDVKAPAKVLANYEPCKDCAEKFSKGHLVIEVCDHDTGGIPIVAGSWPTGRWCVIGRRSARRLFKNDKPSLLPPGLFEALIERARATNK